jgi:hypothetical protein
MRENALTAAEDARLCRAMEGAADRERARLLQLGGGHVLAVVGCGKAKRATRAPARELYTGCLFRAASAWAAAHADRWLIASAKFGLIDPGAEVEPYDLRLGAGREGRMAWARACQSALAGYINRWGLPSKVVILAGGDYAGPLLAWTGLGRADFVEVPLAGLGIGERLRWFKKRRTDQPGLFDLV